MKIIICHLSDIHLSCSNDILLERVEKIKSVIRSNSLNIDTCFFVISGDIANTGQKEEYIQALSFIDSFNQLKKPYGSLENVYYILTPGNHDCNFAFSESKSAEHLRNTAIECYLTKNIIDDNIIGICTSVQENYFDFQSVCQSSDCLMQGNTLHRIYIFNIHDKEILFQTFNTAWMSKKKEDPGKLKFPVEFVNRILPRDYYAVVSVFHHPCNWLEPGNRRAFMKFIEETSDIIITGHEHLPESCSQETDESSTQYYIGGVLQDKNNKDDSSFNLLFLDLENNKEMLIKYYWHSEDEIYKPEKRHIEWTDFIRNKYIKKKVMQFNDDFRNKLMDIGAKFEHPYKDPIFLSDIFIYPNLKLITLEKKLDEIESHIKSDNVIENIINKKKFIITGDSSSGKTSMAKKLCLDLSQRGYISLFADAYEFRSQNEEDITKTIERKFSEQYIEALWEEYKQLPITKKALIIDDFQNINLNANGKIELINRFFNIFDLVVIFATVAFRMENLVSKSAGIGFMNFTNCIILDFGHYLRNRLIKKWYTLGREYTAEEYEINARCRDAEETVNTIIGKNFLPSYPIYVLLILNQLETKHNLNPDISSYGYLYEALINNSLLKINNKTANMDINITYLTVIAYYMYINKKRNLYEDDIIEITRFYNKSYSQNVVYQTSIDNFIKAKIMKGNLKECTFQYSYIYYFFVAKYLTNNIEMPEVKEFISNMSKKLYNEDYGNIMIFLCHLSKNPFIIDELLLNAMLIYEKHTACDFDNHIGFIKRMYDKIPEVSLPSGNVEENKEKLLKLKDKHEDKNYLKDKRFENYEETTDDPMVNEILMLNKSFKTIQILGQILRNYPGSIFCNVKYDIAKECHLLGMRTLNFFLTLIDDNVESIVSFLVESYNKKRELKDKSVNIDKIHELAQIYIFKIVELVSLGMVRNVAASIANENLKETYRELLEQNNETSFRLINIAIKLNCLNILSVDEVVDLSNKLEKEKNLFSLNILKRIVTSYFYLNDCDHAKKQYICDKLKLSKKTVTLISAKGADFKKNKA